jgi:hypothetical protein
MAATLTAAGVAMHRHDGTGRDELGPRRAPSGDRVAWSSDSEGNNLPLTETS